MGIFFNPRTILFSCQTAWNTKRSTSEDLECGWKKYVVVFGVLLLVLDSYSDLSYSPELPLTAA